MSAYAKDNTHRLLILLFLSLSLSLIGCSSNNGQGAPSTDITPVIEAPTSSALAPTSTVTEPENDLPQTDEHKITSRLEEQKMIFLNDSDSKAASIIDSSIESAIKIIIHQPLSNFNSATLSHKHIPFTPDTYWYDSNKSSIKELIDIAIDHYNKLEAFTLDSETYGDSLVVDALLAIPHLSLFDPRLDCFYSLGINNETVHEVFFDPEGDAASRLIVGSEAFNSALQNMDIFDSVISRIVRLMPVEFTSYQRYFYLALVLGLQCDYSNQTTNCQTAYGALINGHATSEGYSKAYYLLCKEANLACSIVNGYLNTDKHMWNMVELSSGSYHLDVTLCDEKALQQGVTSSLPELSDFYLFYRDQWFDYFCCSQEVNSKSGHITSDDIIATGSNLYPLSESK